LVKKHQLFYCGYNGTWLCVNIHTIEKYRVSLTHIHVHVLGKYLRINKKGMFLTLTQNVGQFWSKKYNSIMFIILRILIIKTESTSIGKQ